MSKIAKRRSFKNAHSSQVGLSLVAIIVGLAMAGIAIAVLTQVHKFAIGQQNQVIGRGDRETLKHQLLNLTDCPATMAAAGCPTHNLIRVQKKGSAAGTLIDNTGTGTKLGKWTLRAECGGNGGLIVRAANLSPSGNLNSIDNQDFLLDPATAMLGTWASPQAALFPTGFELCQPNPGSGPPPPGPCANTYCPWTSPQGQFVLQPGDLTFIQYGSGGAIYTGTAYCPSGYRVVNGSANCQFGTWGGATQSSMPTPTANGWIIQCWTKYNSGVYPPSVAGVFAATCVKL